MEQLGALKGASLVWTPGLLANIRLGWRGLSGTNTLVYITFVNYSCKAFYYTGPRSDLYDQGLGYTQQSGAWRVHKH